SRIFPPCSSSARPDRAPGATGSSATRQAPPSPERAVHDSRRALHHPCRHGRPSTLRLRTSLQPWPASATSFHSLLPTVAPDHPASRGQVFRLGSLCPPS